MRSRTVGFPESGSDLGSAHHLSESRPAQRCGSLSTLEPIAQQLISLITWIWSTRCDEHRDHWVALFSARRRPESSSCIGQGSLAGTGAPRDRIAARLKALESAGVIDRTPYSEGPVRYEYRLTESGTALMPVLDALLDWGKHHAVAPDDPDRQRRYRPMSELKVKDPR